MPRADPSLLTEAFHVSEWRPPSLIYMGFISLTPHLPRISLCVDRGSCERALHDLLQVAVCRVNTSNYRVPVQPWKDWTSMENQFDNYQVSENVIVQKRLGTYTQRSCRPTVFFDTLRHFLVLHNNMASTISRSHYQQRSECRPKLRSSSEIYVCQSCENLRWKTFGYVVMMWESVTHLTVLERLNAQTPPRIVRDHFLLTSSAWAQLLF